MAWATSLKVPQNFACSVHCAVVCVWRPDDAHPEALSALRHGLNLPRVLKDAKSVKHESIVTFHNLRYDVYSQLANFDQNSGIKVCVRVGQSAQSYICFL